MTKHEQKVLRFVSQAAIYVSTDGEGVRIDYWDADEQDDDYQGCFYGTGGDTGELYMIPFNKVNFEEDMFFKLVLMEEAE